MADSLGLQTDVVRQHTVPRFLLEGFATLGRGKYPQLYTFDKHNERSFVTNIMNATVRNTFYNLDDHPERLSLEPLMGIYESEAAPVIHQLLECRDIRNLSGEERYKLAVFVAIQRARTFSEQQRITGMISAIADKVTAMGATPEQVTKALGFSPERDSRNIFLQQLVQQASHIDHLLAKDWYLFETTSDHPFYVSDSPVVMHNNNDFGPYGNLGLALPGIQIYLPLSSTLTLGMYCPSIRDLQISRKRDLQRRMALAPLTLPPGLNPASRIAKANALINFHTMKSAPDQVMWLNSQQVRFSEQYVFCEKDDFALVRKMISDSQSFKTGLRFTIG
ncbi:DUF4238 domain-containing protein [Pectobacterium carotovorum]|uniref:DUF4238 domain-containing protein n=1 Tax=Pectobacterium TaxID=122277 RepID=UPI00050314FB|nr:DUF4238 domain-containing protein [Pectobacterium carotovorum]KFW99835.1 hypothetical protein JV33_12800 [Pectobacterium carotovorum subsp. carotovorum]KHT37478.1 hypothetical protein RC99_08260 [Pectobacterium carotovorum subsp. carotovorum]KML69561.1 hypothetical protein G032_11550 [Pectobacterium carotovorum subsp. carotovorum ICMP 5702]SHG11028.1 Protein of unknown function [Pectobacterium carotovorum]